MQKLRTSSPLRTWPQAAISAYSAHGIYRGQGVLQVNSIVLDGSVSKDGRMNHWTSEHKRIIFATPQAFKNDVFKGKTVKDRPERRLLRIF